MLKLVIHVEIAIPLIPNLRLKAKKVVIGTCKDVATKLDHINGFVVP